MRIIKRTLLILSILVLIPLIYSAVIISEVGPYTEKVIMSDLEKEQWRIYADEPRAFSLSLKDLSVERLDALVKIQDPDFWRHGGIDLSTPGAGFTTITQAIVKKLYFEDFKPGFAKFRQSLIAVVIVDNSISKEDQLRLFINLAYMGSNSGVPIYGFADAARHYYGKSFAALSYDEYLSLLAMLIAPATYNIQTQPEKNRERVARIKAVLSGKYKPKGLRDQYYEEFKIEENKQQALTQL